MNALDKALLEFVRRSDGKTPTRIYMVWNVLNEIRTSDKYYQLDMVNRLYQGVPFYRVANDDDHLAIY